MLIDYFPDDCLLVVDKATSKVPLTACKTATRPAEVLIDRLSGCPRRRPTGVKRGILESHRYLRLGNRTSGSGESVWPGGSR